jgi:hypothetical protein
MSGAVDALRLSESPLALARGLLDHGRLLRQLGRPVEAEAMINENTGLFTALRAARWL